MEVCRSSAKQLTREGCAWYALSGPPPAIRPVAVVKTTIGISSSSRKGATSTTFLGMRMAENGLALKSY